MKNDVLNRPGIARHTKRIIALQKLERAAAEKLGKIVADIGDELIATRADLDNTDDKTAWLRWLKKHVRYSVHTARHYMTVARLRKKMEKRFSIFLRFDVTCLYRVASLPDYIIDTLTPDTELVDPKTGQKKPIGDMSSREIDRALDALQGRKKKTEKLIDTQHGIDCEVILTGATTREAFAAAARQHLDSFVNQLRKTDVRRLGGKLSPETKRAFLAAVESARLLGLSWPAWSKPVPSRKRSPVPVP